MFAHLPAPVVNFKPLLQASGFRGGQVSQVHRVIWDPEGHLAQGSSVHGRALTSHNSSLHHLSLTGADTVKPRLQLAAEV